MNILRAGESAPACSPTSTPPCPWVSHPKPTRSHHKNKMEAPVKRASIYLSRRWAMLDPLGRCARTKAHRSRTEAKSFEQSLLEVGRTQMCPGTSCAPAGPMGAWEMLFSSGTPLGHAAQAAAEPRWCCKESRGRSTGNRKDGSSSVIQNRNKSHVAGNSPSAH